MKRKKAAPKAARGAKGANRNALPMFSSDFLVFRTGIAKVQKTAALRKRDSASVLTLKVGRALAKPGVSKSVVFRDSRTGVFAYAVDPSNPSKIVRRSRGGAARPLRSSSIKAP